jgi:hypothetical protein
MKYIYVFILYIQSLFRFIFIDWRNLNIKRNDIVADLGCGGRPLVRADILVDKYLSGTAERPTDFVDTGAYIIQADLSRLPFKSKSIDFIYSSHVVEHLAELNKTLDEKSRVGKRGFIGCPSALREKIISLKMHLWFVEQKNNELIFTKKKIPYTEFINDYFESFIASFNNYLWIKLEHKFYSDFNISFFWQDNIPYKIFGKQDQPVWKSEEDSPFCYSESTLMKIRKYIIIVSTKLVRFFYSKNFNIIDLLCCPRCRNELLLKREYLKCTNCGLKYKHINKRIFYFLNN